MKYVLDTKVVSRALDVGAGGLDFDLDIAARRHELQRGALDRQLLVTRERRFG